jgi:hypothetical protein
LRLTDEGKLHPFLRLEPDLASPGWPELPNHFLGVEGKRRPGASVWLSAAHVKEAPTAKSMNKDRGILLHQPYGLGRVIYLGIESTWRWRFRVGDTYHHRFWGQLLHWAADQRLPAGNRFVRYGARDPITLGGEPIRLAARLSGELPPLPAGTTVSAKVYRQRDGQAEELAKEITLQPTPGQPLLLEAPAPKLPPGVYRMALDIAPYREQIAEVDEKAIPGSDRFRVLPRESEELLDLSTNEQQLTNLAHKSNGKVYALSNLDELVERLARRVERTESVQAWKPWETTPLVWWVLAGLLTLLGAEWAWRKWLELP